MHKTLVLIRTHLSDALSYRGDIFLYTIANIIQPLVLIAIWLAIGASGGSLPLPQVQLVQYYLLGMFIQIFTGAWASPFLSRDIRLGGLSPFLVKPLTVLQFQIGQNLAEKLFKTLYTLPVIIFLFLVSSTTFPAAGPLIILFFFAAILLAGIFLFFADLCIGLSAFWLEDALSLREFYDFTRYLFSGRLFPLVALPLWLRSAAVILPFRYTHSFPLEIILNQLTPVQMAIGFGYQLIWVIAVVLLYHQLWHRGLKVYSASGA
ncbi:MAG: hypothetical protein UX87_C0002G0016 [Candidatus Amesbacteria bacterium GW2011_GWA1_47_16]|uniref:ABC transporter permease n=5 Tax=Candidatus Amesiibacteriota TaxID=1752730 RepID=A0A1F4ZRG0_9BACT|nr:MAG: hypothetical protein UX87_C0002G0016 [Candidatus Amesbacteria bacterium GW2011_GWA1_47_16]KKU65184.1 MAG: hypothetical protein UX86_C0001G0040 [Candidatus Amesbacteria bacterium GW2011_GWC1_47_15]KKU98455.1 MAG: hypothetical protein UY28_C0001G0005 [Candidatus Amesbacteria bacterium GW2011_GWB1_48_13]OGD00327.1 MAG: hypothetical protein A2972_00785 [Candidatus Amesbacteria bacterium RIFCSPLOWO2_01_FULL_47_33]OGD00899.1 MAG: hypothetical protein A2701_00625 [Candidatus Amesbacteria bacte